jgi:hypothetical protein
MSIVSVTACQSFPLCCVLPLSITGNSFKFRHLKGYCYIFRIIIESCLVVLFVYTQRSWDIKTSCNEIVWLNMSSRIFLNKIFLRLPDFISSPHSRRRSALECALTHQGHSTQLHGHMCLKMWHCVTSTLVAAVCTPRTNSDSLEHRVTKIAIF